jgi:Glycosyl hydrolase catalytic core
MVLVHTVDTNHIDLDAMLDEYPKQIDPDDPIMTCDDDSCRKYKNETGHICSMLDVDHSEYHPTSANLKILGTLATPRSDSCSDDLSLDQPTKSPSKTNVSFFSTFTSRFTALFEKNLSVQKSQDLPLKYTKQTSFAGVTDDDEIDLDNTERNDPTKSTKIWMKNVALSLIISSFAILITILVLVSLTFGKLHSIHPDGTKNATGTEVKDNNMPWTNGDCNGNGKFDCPPTSSPAMINNMNSNTNSSDSNSSACTIYPTPPRLNGKKGAARTLRPIGRTGSWRDNLPGVIDINPYWNYNWDIIRIDAQPIDIEFIPMAWGASEQLESNLQQYVQPYIENGIVKRFLGFNEPDHELQSNVAVSKALELWPLFEALNVPLISPSCWQPKGEWMIEFMKLAIEQCRRIDYIGVHWYGSTSFAAFKNDMEEIYNMYGQIPLVITEFSPADWTAKNISMNRHNKSEVLQFMKQALPWLEQQDWIHGYAWFSFPFNDTVGAPSALFTDDGRLTICGQYYASVTGDNPLGNQSLSIWNDESD